jgi:hypothetical protein
LGKKREVERWWVVISPKGLFGKWRIEVDGRGLKGILGNFEL